MSGIAGALIDGEAIVLGDDERHDFGAPMTKRSGAQTLLVEFDLLRFEDDGLRERPLDNRREPDPPSLIFSVFSVFGDGVTAAPPSSKRST